MNHDFQALELSLATIRSLRAPLLALRGRDPKLCAQIRAAASSVTLNLSEGNRRSGRDRLHHWRVAAGSAAEVRAALLVARAWGDLSDAALAEPLELLDRVLAIFWRLTH